MSKSDQAASSKRAKEAFETWRKEFGEKSTEESARKVWRMYNNHLTEEEADESFPSGGSYAKPEAVESASLAQAAQATGQAAGSK